MPLVTEIFRNGEIHVPEGGWSEYALNCFMTAALKEHDSDKAFEDGGTLGDLPDGMCLDFVWRMPIYLLDRSHFNSPLVKRGEQTLLSEHTFPGNDEIPAITFLPGDRFRMWRE